MFKVATDWFEAAVREREPIVVLGLLTPGGRRLYARLAPSLNLSGFQEPVPADGTRLADGAFYAGRNASPILSRRGDALSLGRLSETLQASAGELIGLLSAGRAGDVSVKLRNTVDEEELLHFSRLVALGGEGLVGSQAEITINFPELNWEKALKRFYGRVEQASVGPEEVVLRLRSD